MQITKLKTLCDGTIIVMKYDKLIQIIRNDKVDFFRVPEDDYLRLSTGEVVKYNENLGFPSGKFWINVFELPTTSSIECEDSLK